VWHFALFLSVYDLQVSGKTSQSPVARQSVRKRLVVFPRRRLPELLRKFRRTGRGNAGGYLVDDAQRPGQRVKTGQFRHQ
jgi:hypothetical protein